ncbi:MAG: DUF937 domain-containing protein [Acidobacteriota bacterium]
MSIVNMLMQSLGDDAVQQLGSQIGADSQATRTAIQGAVPMLLGAMAKNAGSQQGAQSLLSALDRDHDGSILDDVAGFVGQGGDGGGAGAGILRHVLGGQQGAVEQGLAQVSGLNGGQAGQLMSMLAPMVMGAIGRQKTAAGVGADQLGALLTGEANQARQAAPNAAMGMLAGFLDQDGDGSVVDDLAQMGGKLLGNFLGGKR